MPKKLSEQDKQFIKDNWNTTTNAKLGGILGVCAQTITIAGRKLGLEDKKELIKRSLETSEEDLRQIERYKRSSEAVKEAEGRKKTLDILDLKKRFKLGQEIKFKSFDGLNTRRIIEGKIIQKTDHLLIVKSRHEVISLAYRDFYTRRTIII